MPPGPSSSSMAMSSAAFRCPAASDGDARPRRSPGMKLTEARVLLTGAAGGIGAASAHALLAAGASVMLTGRDVARLRDLARSLEQAHRLASPVEWFAGDLLAPTGV